MIIVSNHLLTKTDWGFTPDTILRVNVAWIKDREELHELLSKYSHDVYLDYPTGRTKPPRPTLTLDETIDFAHKFPNVKYFAVSNAEDPEKISDLIARLPKHVEFVPKIETRLGVERLDSIIRKTGIKHIMLDKEDLYVDVGTKAEEFEQLVEKVRQVGRDLGINVLELRGVVFTK